MLNLVQVGRRGASLEEVERKDSVVDVVVVKDTESRIYYQIDYADYA